jgi:hypothetical protein
MKKKMEEVKEEIKLEKCLPCNGTGLSSNDKHCEICLGTGLK